MSFKKAWVLPLAALPLAFCFSTAFAAQSPEPARDSDAVVAKLKEKLSLSDEQVAKIKQIMQNTRDEAEKLREQFRALEEKTKEDFKSVLSDEQFKKWEALKEEHRRQAPPAH